MSGTTYLSGLRVFRQRSRQAGAAVGSEFELLGAQSLTFKTVASLAGFALDLLRSRPNHIVFKSLTNRILDERDLHQAPLKLYKEGKSDDIVTTFLEDIRCSFPHIVVTDVGHIAVMNGRTTKRNCDAGNNFYPQKSGVIELNAILIGKLVDAVAAIKANRRSSPSTYDMEVYRALHVRLGITLAHELVHLYTHYLVRRQQSHTPPNITYGPYGDGRKGESGRYWEERLFGGYIDMQDRVEPDPSDSRKLVRGPPVIGIWDGHQRKLWQIKTKALDDLLGREFSKYLGDQLIDHAGATSALRPERWNDSKYYLDPFTDPGDRAREKDRAGGWELSAAQVNYLVSEQVRDHAPKYAVSRTELQRFSNDPTLAVSLRVM